LDVDAYLQRIGYRGAREPGRTMLDELVRCHAQALPFENLDAFLGRRISLDPQVIERKFVQQGRGGWCFEQNLLLGNALRALGLQVTDLAGRVLWNRPSGAITARTHRLLLVRAQGRDWVADVGFGGHTMTGVLDLHCEDPQETMHEPFRLRGIGGGERVLESLIAGEWKSLCRFDLQPQLPIDFEAANYQLAHDPESHFTQALVVSRVAEDGRHILRGRELCFHRTGGDSTRRDLGTTQEIVAAMRDVFGLRLDAALETALNARFEAQSFSAARS
jgi:N-hydroxyarylamine O-acetyltransferase